MAVPKRKMSRSATRSRKSANMRLVPPAHSLCPNCGASRLPHTVWGRRDAPQFGHSECAGGASFMFADLRERVAERLILRFGTAMVRSSS